MLMIANKKTVLFLLKDDGKDGIFDKVNDSLAVPCLGDGLILFQRRDTN